MSGISRHTGEIIPDVEAVKESIIAILTTPIGSRLIEKEYGSRLFELIDSPVNNTLDINIAVAAALDRWEPRFKLKKIEILPADGTVTLLIRGDLVDTSETLALEIGI